MAFFTFKISQQAKLHVSPFCYPKYPSPLNHLKICSLFFHSTIPPPKPQPRASLGKDQEISKITRRSSNHSENGSGFSFLYHKSNRVTSRERNELDPLKRRVSSSGVPGVKSNNGPGKNGERCKEKATGISGRVFRKSKVLSLDNKFKAGLGMCSKRGDVLCAIRMYELARKEGVEMDQYHYSVLLYLCSSAAAGILQPEKSGSGCRSLISPDTKEVCFGGFEDTNEHSTTEDRKRDGEDNGLVSVLDKTTKNRFRGNGFPSEVAVPNPDATLDELSQAMLNTSRRFSEAKDERAHKEVHMIQVSQEVKRFALEKGFEIFQSLRSENVLMNEAMLTSAARLAMSVGDGDMAFGLVKQMKESGATPRLRSYGPALHCFCNRGDVEKAFVVEAHMLENGVFPEGPELEALLKASVDAENSDKIYYVLHKLRTNVRQVSPSTAHLIEKWFLSNSASRVGNSKWDQKLIRREIENGGGGWHGQGWLGKGEWVVSQTSVGSDGFCKCCGERLATIDLDPEETQNFAQSVASLAAQREKKSNFQIFQKWLNQYGPFEAVVDGANVGLLDQREFNPSKINVIANGIRQMLPSKRWPLIVLHNRRVSGDKMQKPFDRALIEKWRAAGALYETPTGSNDDWYWLYAAIKFKCLIVTNDEMRDHLFQLLGNDFFPKWKERHQVHFGFSGTSPLICMPPKYSVVIQESEKGHWHIPIVSELGSEETKRTWLCVTRRTSTIQVSKNSPNVSRASESEVLQKLSAAEMLGNCVIDFQI
ncbi:hypothetical protein DM860_004113 [Cuscuta australis]|uniref:ribonuclease P n=1 Tax=Cuscuta australis TaxID=267555 RepID=A0A328CY09_9ASTE|nr:hypothetical protein DM860_004113 [Cuscuta australis]